MLKAIKIGLIAVGLILIILLVHREMRMPQSVTLVGITYDIPDVGEDIWGENVTSYLVALSTQVLTKAGGIFTLTAPVDFGASHGFLSEYVSARPGAGDAVSATGLIRLRNSQTIGWRNAAQNGDLGLSVNASNELIFNELAVLYGTLPALNSLSPLTTKGDVIAHDGTNNVRLAVGTDGQALVADTASAAGVKWETFDIAETFNANLINGRAVPLYDFTVPAKLANPAALPASTSYASTWSPDGRFLCVGHAVSPFITIYERSGTTFTKLANPADLPAGTGRGAAFSPDGRFLSVAHLTSPFVTIYERSGTTFTKLTNPAALPAGSGRATGWSPDGRFLSIAHSTTPFITIYQRSGTTFTKLDNPATLPTNESFGVAWSPDGRFLSVVSFDTPFILIYERSGTTFTKLSDPADLPTDLGNAVAWSPDGEFLSVAHETSPFVTIYQRSGTTFTKLANPAALPIGDAFGTSWSPDGRFLSIAHFTTPFITIYQRSGTTFTKLADPDLPAGIGRGQAFSPDGRFLSLAHSTTPFITIYETASEKPDVSNKSPLIKFMLGDQGDW